MNNNNKNSALNKPAVSCSFYDFAKNYIRIKDGANERSFNDEELKQVEEMQQMMDKGYELRLVHLRKGRIQMKMMKKKLEFNLFRTKMGISKFLITHNGHRYM